MGRRYEEVKIRGSGVHKRAQSDGSFKGRPPLDMGPIRLSPGATTARTKIGFGMQKVLAFIMKQGERRAMSATALQGRLTLLGILVLKPYRKRSGLDLIWFGSFASCFFLVAILC